MDDEVLETFSEEQRASMEHALLAEHAHSRGFLNLRGSLPLGFTRVYLHFVMGRDRRSWDREVIVERRERRGFFRRAAGLLLLLLAAAALALLLILAANNFVEHDLLETLGIRDGLHWLSSLFGSGA